MTRIHPNFFLDWTILSGEIIFFGVSATLDGSTTDSIGASTASTVTFSPAMDGATETGFSSFFLAEVISFISRAASKSSNEYPFCFAHSAKRNASETKPE